MSNSLGRRDFLLSVGGAATALALAAPDARAASSRIKVGQIGTGHAHAAGKMSSLRSLTDDYEVVGVVENDPALRQAAEKDAAYRGLTWMTEEQLLSTPGLKAVAVETTVPDLVPAATRCVARGLHVHLDKPAGESLAAYRQLLDTATARLVTVQMGFMFRHNPAFRFCFQAVRDGWLGKIFAVHGVMAKQISPAERRRAIPERGGVMFELGCHVIDAMVSVLGKAETVTPFAAPTRTDLDPLADRQMAVFRYPGALGTIDVNVTEVDGGRRRQFVVCGSEGTLEIKPLEPAHATLALDRPRGKFRKGLQELSLPVPSGRYDDQLRELARIARGAAPSEYPPAHDLAVHELVLRASGLSVDA